MLPSPVISWYDIITVNNLKCLLWPDTNIYNSNVYSDTATYSTWAAHAVGEWKNSCWKGSSDSFKIESYATCLSFHQDTKVYHSSTECHSHSQMYYLVCSSRAGYLTLFGGEQNNNSTDPSSVYEEYRKFDELLTKMARGTLKSGKHTSMQKNTFPIKKLLIGCFTQPLVLWKKSLLWLHHFEMMHDICA